MEGFNQSEWGMAARRDGRGPARNLLLRGRRRCSRAVCSALAWRCSAQTEERVLFTNTSLSRGVPPPPLSTPRPV